MKFLRIIHFTFLIIIFFIPYPLWAEVWSKKEISLIHLYANEKTTRYSLNDIQVTFAHGKMDIQLSQLLNALEREALSQNKLTHSNRLKNHLLHCSMAKPEDENWSQYGGQCLFARKKNNKILYQRISLSGLPNIHKPKEIDLEGLPLTLHAKDQYFHLQPDQKNNPFQLFHYQKPQKDEPLLPHWKNTWEKNGWQEIEWKNHHILFLTKSKKILLATEKKESIMVLISGQKFHE